MVGVGIIVLAALVAGGVWYYVTTQTQPSSQNLLSVAPTPISSNVSSTAFATPVNSTSEAIALVNNLPDVKQWMAQFTGPNETSPKTGGVPVIEIDSETTSTYVVHAYESMSDHDATFNWYTVDKMTGTVTSEF